MVLIKVFPSPYKQFSDVLKKSKMDDSTWRPSRIMTSIMMSHDHTLRTLKATGLDVIYYCWVLFSQLQFSWTKVIVRYNVIFFKLKKLRLMVHKQSNQRLHKRTEGREHSIVYIRLFIYVYNYLYFKNEKKKRIEQFLGLMSLPTIGSRWNLSHFTLLFCSVEDSKEMYQNAKTMWTGTGFALIKPSVFWRSRCSCHFLVTKALYCWFEDYRRRTPFVSKQ